jgi:AcrR family transcriptional regulator
VHTETNARARILVAARRLFAQQGFDATTVRQICREARSNLALVSYHFGGKESVFFALFDSYFPMEELCFESEVEAPAENLRQVIGKLVRFKLEQPEMVTIIQQEILMNSPRLIGMSRHMYPVYNRLRQVLETGREQGVFQYDSTDHTMIFVMAVSIFPAKNAFIRPLLSHHQLETEDLLEDTMSFVFKGLGYRESEQRGLQLA